MELDRPLSALEHTVLGILMKRGPCNAHAVVLEFANSRTWAYRSGAGSVYPLLKRLTEAGLVSFEGKQYSLSEKGRASLRSWLLPPFGEGEISTSLDVLRSRVYFLRLLSREEIRAFTEAARVGLEELLANCEAQRQAYVASGDAFSEMAMVGTVKETQARLEWIAELRLRFG